MTNELNSQTEVAENAKVSSTTTESSLAEKDQQGAEQQQKQEPIIQEQQKTETVPNEQQPDYTKQLHDTKAWGHQLAQENAQLKGQVENLVTAITGSQAQVQQNQSVDYQKLAESLYENPAQALQEFEKKVTSKVMQDMHQVQQTQMQEQVRRNMLEQAISAKFNDYPQVKAAMSKELQEMGRVVSNQYDPIEYLAAEALYNRAKIKANPSPSGVVGVNGRPSVQTSKPSLVTSEIENVARNFGISKDKLEKRMEQMQKEGGKKWE